MLICTLDREKFECLNTVIKDKNTISPLNSFATRNLSAEDISLLGRMGMVTAEGTLLDTIEPTVQTLANPRAVVKLIFTGGVGSYEHNISFDDSLENHVSFTVTPEHFSIDDEMDPESILRVIRDFVGISNLKSMNIIKKYSTPEAFVIAAMLDMERRSSLRAFVDEVPVMHNSYNANMIWRIINSTSKSIQWFVSILEEVIGEHITLSLLQVQNALEQLKGKGTVVQKGGQYQLSKELSQLSDRMVIIDNTLSIQISKLEEEVGVVSAGFTCIQSGVHDLLLLDYDGRDVVFETITTVRLLDYLEQFLNYRSALSKL